MKFNVFKLSFEMDFVKLAKLELNFSLLSLIEKLINSVTAGVKVTVTHSEIAEHCFESCLYSDLSIPKNSEVSVVNHSSINCFALIAGFFCEQSITLIICD